MTNAEMLNLVRIIPVVQDLIDDLWERRRATWNPLDDNGEALKLAVHLGIDIIQDKIQKETVAKFYVGSELQFVAAVRWGMMEKTEATRRAIVMVAAQIAVKLDIKQTIS